MNKQFEFLEREEIEQYQLEKIQALLNKLFINVPYYKKIFTDNKITPTEIKSFTDLKKIPFMDKEILRLNQPYGLFAIPLREIVRFHFTSGTTGEPIAVGYSKNDIKHWSELIARTLSNYGVNENDVVQIAFEYGMFTGGLGFHYGAEILGASIIPVSDVNPEHQLKIMKDYKTTVFLSTPTLALSLSEAIEKSNFNKNELSLRLGIFGAEPWNEEVREKIETNLNINAFDSYGLTEIIGPGVASECDNKNGLHLSEDLFYCEIINPRTLEILPDETEGELVITTFTKEGFPLLRYRTGDITTLTRKKCGCGRTTARIARIKERTNDIIIINGIKIYPQAISKIISEEENLGQQFEIIITRENGRDKLQINVEIKSGCVVDVYNCLLNMSDSIRNKISGLYNISPVIKLVEPSTLSHIKKNYKITDKR